MNFEKNIWTEAMSGEDVQGELRIEAGKRFHRFQLPETVEEWETMRPRIISQIKQAIRFKYYPNCALDVREYGDIDCGTYIIKKIAYQSRENLYVSAALYIPKGDGPFPAVINMHGHYLQGHLAAEVQARAHILVQHGFVVLSPDAFGAGERTPEYGEYTYHGAFLGGALFSINESLIGMQLSDNMRGIDLLCSLSYVDKENIGATGASGGGNQTMYLAAFDERIKASMPVASVGSYQSYVCGTNCICELIPDGLDFCEESAVIALTAPRRLNICNALQDINRTFGVTESHRTISEARKVYKALGANGKLTSQAFNTPHGYFPETMEAMTGFFLKELKDEGDGTPLVTKYTPLEEESLWAFPDKKRFRGIKSIPEFVTEAKSAIKPCPHASSDDLKQILKITDVEIVETYDLFSSGIFHKYLIEDKKRRQLPVLFKKGTNRNCRIIASSEGKPVFEDSEDSILVFEHFGVGEQGEAKEEFPVHYKQHNLSRALMWLGRRLMGEWTEDWLLAAKFVRDMLPNSSVELYGYYDSGPAALFSAVLEDDNIISVILDGIPKSILYCDNRQSEHSPSMAVCLPGLMEWHDLEYAAEFTNADVKFKNVFQNI